MRYEQHWSEGRGFRRGFHDFASRMKYLLSPMFDAPTGKYVVVKFQAEALLLTSPCFSRIKEGAAIAATRGDLGQLAPRKKLLKS
jgi:hypothetical protein